MKLLIALLVVATVLDLSLSASTRSLKGREFSRNKRSSGATVSVQENAEKLDQFLMRTFSRTKGLKALFSNGLSATGMSPFRVLEDMHDIVLVLDSSASIGGNEFIKAKQFMADIVRLLPTHIIVSRDKARIACISFSERNKIITEFGFLTHTSESSVIQAINRIPYHHGGSTHTTKALQKAKNLFETAGRPGAQKILFLATDGNSNGGGNPTVPADQMKIGLDVTIFVAAVSNVNVQEVESIASSPGHWRPARAARDSRPYVIYVDSFNEALRVTGAVRKMQMSRRLRNNPRLSGIHGWLSRGLAQ